MARCLAFVKIALAGVFGGICAFLVGLVSTRLVVGKLRAGSNPWTGDIAFFTQFSDWELAGWVFYGSQFVGKSWREGPYFGEREPIVTQFLWAPEATLLAMIPIVSTIGTVGVLLHFLPTARRMAIVQIVSFAIGYGGIAIVGAFLLRVMPTSVDAGLFDTIEGGAPTWFIESLGPMQPDLGSTIVFMGVVYPLVLGFTTYLAYENSGHAVGFVQRYSAIGRKTAMVGIAGGSAAFLIGLLATRPLVDHLFTGHEEWIGEGRILPFVPDWDVTGLAFYSAHFVGKSWEEGLAFGENASVLLPFVDDPAMWLFFFVPIFALTGVSLLLFYVLDPSRTEVRFLIPAIAIGYGLPALLGVFLFSLYPYPLYLGSSYPVRPDLGWTVILMGLVYPLVIGSLSFLLYQRGKQVARMTRFGTPG